MNKWQSVEVPSITSGFDEIYEKVEMAPETCQRGRKHNNKSNNNFWYMYAYVITYICMIYIYLTKQVNKVETGKAAYESQRFGQNIYNR